MAEYRISEAWSALHDSGTKFYRMLVVSDVEISDGVAVLIRQWGKKGTKGTVEAYKLPQHEVYREFEKVYRAKSERGGYHLPIPDPSGFDQRLKDLASDGNPVGQLYLSNLFDLVFGSANTSHIFDTLWGDSSRSDVHVEAIEERPAELVIDRSQVYGEAWGMF